MPRSKESSPHPSFSPERFDAVCQGCGQRIISTNGVCPNCASKSVTRTSDDELVKKVVDDNDLSKGGLV